MLEREEMASTTSSESQLQSPQRSPNNSILRPRSSKPDKVSHPPPWEEDLQPEDHPCSPAKKILISVYILESHKFQNNDFIENIPDQNINKDKNQNLHPIVNPEKLELKLFYLIRLLKDSFEKQTNISDRAELFTKMKSHLTLDKESSIDLMTLCEPMKSVLAYYLDEHKRQEKQYAFAVAYLKNGDLIIFPAVYPDHSKGGGRSAVPTKKHSEEKLIQQIDNFLQKNGTKVIKLLVYSYNSPCLRRENNTTCCMLLLLQKAVQWHNMYGFFTDVAFTKPYGLTGPNFFQYLTYSDISNPRSVFLTYIEKCKNIPFKLVSKRKENELRQKLIKMSENSTIYKTIDLVEAAYKEELRSTIKSILHKLLDQANSSSHTKDHLDRGITIITSSEFPPEVRNEIVTALIKNWNKVVINESVSPIRDKIATDFNNAVVQLFGKELKFFVGNSSPLKLYQVPQNMEGEGEYVQQIRELLNLN
ncbi:uncharacterized protein LOC125894156 [Epinephelus fuscoguttatus]|uniref:uncharacterized protein LOC125894156 n=1 Tax=Epinephelus fuscoguttatus TaxID=293821 RepID=UPI0020D11818|nr:uncharacterized protein LOC125894156 [Epinephelus fuscoguttatus]